MNSPKSVRAIFISDQHLGFRFSRAAECLEFLKQYRTDKLFLVGDFLDGWRLARKWYWLEDYDRLVDEILDRIQTGTQVFYTPGNHDDFLRNDPPAIHGIEIEDYFFHSTKDGRKILITHGDLFDSVEKKFHRLSKFGSSAYDLLTQVNYATNRMLKTVGLPEWNYCFDAKRISKSIVGAAGGFRTVLSDFAKEHHCHGVICGHIHRPEIVKHPEFFYANCGDWVEHRSGIIEQLDGSLVLMNGNKELSRLPARQPKVQAMPKWEEREDRPVAV